MLGRGALRLRVRGERRTQEHRRETSRAYCH